MEFLIIKTVAMKKIFQATAIIQIIFFIINPVTAYAVTKEEVADPVGSSIKSNGSSAVSGQVRKGINSFLEDDLNMNVEESLKPLTEGINSVDRKGKIPRTTIRFSTPNPKPGDMLTASAEVEGIANADKAYYTWFLKRSSDESYDPPQRMHENAVKAQASIYYDPEMRDQRFNQGMPTEGDEDTFDAPLGGKDTGSEDKYCYIYDTKDGKQYEIVGGDSSPANLACDEGYIPRCMIDNNALQCPLIIEPITGTTSSSSSGSGSGSSTNTQADTSSSSSSSASTTLSGGGGARNQVRTRCLETEETPYCDENSGTLQCGESGQLYSYEGEITISTPFCVRVIDTRLWLDPNVNGCNMATDENGEYIYQGAGCLSEPNAENVKIPANKCDIASQEETVCSEDAGVFSREDTKDMGPAVEERYGLNPADDRTTPLADNDGQLIAGVNQQQFTWQYEEGDEITVVVEGQGSESTKHENSSYQTVFAMIEPGCQEILEEDSASKSSYEEAVKEKVVTHLTAIVNPVECISPKMYVKPGTSEYDSLKVDVSQGYNEEASVASGLGQPMHVTASAGQTQGGSISSPTHLYYDWTVTCNNGSEVIDITDKLEGLSQTSGMNIPALDFVADFPDGTADENGNPTENCFNPTDGSSKVEVTAKINEPRKGGGSNFGKSTQIFTIYNAVESQLEAYKTTVNADGKYSPTATSICIDGIDKTFCRVMNNEVIALRAKESKDTGDYAEPGMLSWQVNDKTYVCDTNISEDCINSVGTSNTNTDTILVPMNGRDGDFITVAAQVNEVDIDKNESKQLMRVFRVTEPSVTIEPVTNVVKKVLGTYTNLDEKKFLDESNNVFIAQKGKEITLKAILEPSFLNTANTGPKLTYEWLVDGQIYDTDNEITFIPESETTITVKVAQALENVDRKALKEVFNAGMKDTQVQSYKKTVEIEFSKEDLIANSGVTGFFATASHNAPEYLIFILKMTMLMGIMLLIPSLVLSVGKSA